MVASNSRERIGHLNLNLLSENQRGILVYIALNGPNDAYRVNKDLKFSLSTTQLAFKKLNEAGIIKLKETVKGETDQIRKIYDLTPRGFCFITEVFLNPESGKSYDEVKELLDRHIDLFPDLLKKWDFFINRSQEYFSNNSVDWEQPVYMIPLPDISTHIWCDVLRHTCSSANSCYSWDGKEITVDKIRDEYKQHLLDRLYEDSYGPYADGFVYALKQDKELWSELVPEVQSFIEDFKEKITQLEKKLE